ncbi:MAG: hypothetical protein JXB26_01550 [Candidatus Aminicenantes bacterium]|nr:hypothetical protein [Candidatus Aminicenantes bacterium]
MTKKYLSAAGIVILLFAIMSCSSKPEEGLLKRYFHAVTLNDNQTLATMALEPIKINVDNWEILSVAEEVVKPVTLPELNKKEIETKKALEEHVGPTLDAQEAVYAAQDELKYARTAAARRAARSKVDEMEKKYEEEREKHSQMQKDYNEAKAAAAREEEITIFSLGTGDLPNVRDFNGEVQFKTVDVKINTKSGESKNYKIYMRRYEVQDETLNLTHRGRWIIVRFEVLS